MSYAITKLPEAVSPEGHGISRSFYNEVLYQILLTDLLSLALSAEPLDYRIYTLLHSSTQLSQRTASCLSKDAVLSLTRAGNSLIRSSLIHSFRSNQMSNCERFAQIAQDK